MPHESDRGKTRWVFTFDVGGTFTDLVLFDRQTGLVRTAKVPSTPSDMADAISRGVADLLEDAVSVNDLVAFRGATTVVGNLIHERKGSRIALITTRGFKDILAIRRENRYDLYDLFLKLPDPLVPSGAVFEVEERITAEGEASEQLNEKSVIDIGTQLVQREIEGVAVCLLHSYRNGRHEKRVKDLLRETGFDGPISLSSELVPEIREFERTSTTVANAYVVPKVGEQIQKVRHTLHKTGRPGQLHMMFSNGGLGSIHRALTNPIELVESGPAAGVVAAGRVTTATSDRRLLSFEMGGTTAKMSLLSRGEPDVVSEIEIARISRFQRGSGLPLRIGSVHLLEIGAGGGSIAHVYQGRLLVGPQSAGAVPGPACYGFGGETPTLTDADLVLGFLDANYFLGGTMRLDTEASISAIDRGVAKPLDMSMIEAAWAIRTIADEELAVATRVHCAERGEDPRAYTMVVFGGAGPLHYDVVAARLGVRYVVVPRLCGVGGAKGLVLAPPSVHLVRSYFTSLRNADWNVVGQLYVDMEGEARDLLNAAGADPEKIEIMRSADMRYRGQGYEIDVHVPTGSLNSVRSDLLEAAFRRRYVELFQRELPGLETEVMSWRVAARAPAFADEFSYGPDLVEATKTKGAREVYVGSDGWIDVDVYERDKVSTNYMVRGPAIVEERESTVWVPPGSSAWIDHIGDLRIDLTGAVPTSKQDTRE